MEDRTKDSLTEETGATPEPKTPTMSNRRFALLLASPILAPMALGAVLMFGMLIGCGWMFVAMTFFTAAASAAVGIVGIIGAFINAVNGAGAVLLMVSCALGGLGFVYPIFIVAREFSKGYLLFSRAFTAKCREVWEKVNAL